jgi:hypothetical protein
MRFLADENFPLAAVRRLREAGHDVAVVAHDSPGIPDEQVFMLAGREERIVLTFDRDYGGLILGAADTGREGRSSTGAAAGMAGDFGLFVSCLLAR